MKIKISDNQFRYEDRIKFTRLANDAPIFKGGIKERDIRQKYDRTCFMLAPLRAVIRSNPKMIEKMIEDNQDGTVTVHFYYGDGRTPIDVTVDKSLPDTDVESAPWVRLMEKAFAATRFKEYEQIVSKATEKDFNAHPEKYNFDSFISSPEYTNPQFGSINFLAGVNLYNEKEFVKCIFKQEFTYSNGLPNLYGKNAVPIKPTEIVENAKQSIINEITTACNGDNPKGVAIITDHSHVYVVEGIEKKNGVDYLKFYDQLNHIHYSKDMSLFMKLNSLVDEITVFYPEEHRMKSFALGSWVTTLVRKNVYPNIQQIQDHIAEIYNSSTTAEYQNKKKNYEQELYKVAELAPYINGPDAFNGKSISWEEYADGSLGEEIITGQQPPQQQVQPPQQPPQQVQPQQQPQPPQQAQEKENDNFRLFDDDDDNFNLLNGDAQDPVIDLVRHDHDFMSSDEVTINVNGHSVTQSIHYNKTKASLTESLANIKETDVRLQDNLPHKLFAPLRAMAKSHPEMIRNMITENEDGNTVTVHFTYPGQDGSKQPINVTVDKTVANIDGKSAVWVQYIEKAFAAAEFDKLNAAVKGHKTHDAKQFYNDRNQVLNMKKISFVSGIYSLEGVDVWNCMLPDTYKNDEKLSNAANVNTIDQAAHFIVQAIQAATDKKGLVTLENAGISYVVEGVEKVNGVDYIQYYSQTSHKYYSVNASMFLKLNSNIDQMKIIYPNAQSMETYSIHDWAISYVKKNHPDMADTILEAESYRQMSYMAENQDQANMLIQSFNDFLSNNPGIDSIIYPGELDQNRDVVDELPDGSFLSRAEREKKEREERERKEREREERERKYQERMDALKDIHEAVEKENIYKLDENAMKKSFDEADISIKQEFEDIANQNKNILDDVENEHIKTVFKEKEALFKIVDEDGHMTAYLNDDKEQSVSESMLKNLKDLKGYMEDVFAGDKDQLTTVNQKFDDLISLVETFQNSKNGISMDDFEEFGNKLSDFKNKMTLLLGQLESKANNQKLMEELEYDDVTMTNLMMLRSARKYLFDLSAVTELSVSNYREEQVKTSCVTLDKMRKDVTNIKKDFTSFDLDRFARAYVYNKVCQNYEKNMADNKEKKFISNDILEKNVEQYKKSAEAVILKKIFKGIKGKVTFAQVDEIRDKISNDLKMFQNVPKDPKEIFNKRLEWQQLKNDFKNDELKNFKNLQDPSKKEKIFMQQNYGNLLDRELYKKAPADYAKLEEQMIGTLSEEEKKEIDSQVAENKKQPENPIKNLNMHK